MSIEGQMCAGCGKAEAKMQCPTCIKYKNTEGSYFCGQVNNLPAPHYTVVSFFQKRLQFFVPSHVFTVLHWIAKLFGCELSHIVCCILNTAMRVKWCSCSSAPAAFQQQQQSPVPLHIFFSLHFPTHCYAGIVMGTLRAVR